MVVVGIIAAYLLIMNIIGFALMGIDKRRAVKRLWRISESTLFVVAIIGGSLGSIIGMRFFHHKTKHWYFWVVNVIGLLWQGGLVIYLMR